MFKYFSRTEKVIVVIFLTVFVISTYQIISLFIQSVSVKAADNGGVYSEAFIGKLKYINPVLANFNPIDRDISSLIFSGLMKYNPETGNIEDDIATHTLDINKTTYTFTLKEGVKWHDGSNLTADDIMFTFQEVIQNSDFTNAVLHEGFKGVQLKKISNDTVTFTIEKPYKFFLTNLTIGLLPKHAFLGIPISNIHLSDFNFRNPIGSGPYKVQSILDIENNSVKVSLIKNESYYGDLPKIDNINFYVFSNAQQLRYNENIIDAVSQVHDDQLLFFEQRKQFTLYPYYLPQYVAAFFNTENKHLNDKLLRLGLALSIDKEQLMTDMTDYKKVDTPFLELDNSNWMLQYDKNKAQGALNDAGWKLPWKQEIDKDKVEEKLQENTSLAKDPKFINSPNEGKNFVTDNNHLMIEGSVPEDTVEVYVNNYKLKLFKQGNPGFSYRASSSVGTLKEGINDYKVEIVGKNAVKRFLDSIKIFYSSDENNRKEAENEFKLAAEKHKSAKSTIEKKATEKIENVSKSVPKVMPYRINELGDKLELHLITSKSPENYQILAKKLKNKWREIGVNVVVELLEINELQERVNKRDYDILLFGQKMGYNLDTYSYWHSSQKEQGFNFSSLSSFKIDTLLEEIRSLHDNEKRQKKLNQLEEELIKEMPAVFLYTPTSYYSASPLIKGVDINNLRMTRDRFSKIDSWHINEKNLIKEDVKVTDFFVWMYNEIFQANEKTL